MILFLKRSLQSIPKGRKISQKFEPTYDYTAVKNVFINLALNRVATSFALQTFYYSVRIEVDATVSTERLLCCAKTHHASSVTLVVTKISRAQLYLSSIATI